MQSFKKEHFKNEFPDREFPELFSLSSKDLKHVEKKLREKFEVGDSNSLRELVKKVSSLEKIIDNFNASDKSFSLLDVFSSLNIKCNDYVYINWYIFDDIDKIKLISLSDYFNDIWYPGADDIDIFDESLTWMLSVRHDGVLSRVAGMV